VNRFRQPFSPATGAALAILFAACPAKAHLNSLTMCEARLEGRTIRLTVETRRPDLAEALGLSSTAVPTRAQILRGRTRIARYLASRIRLKSSDLTCRFPGLDRLTVGSDKSGLVRIRVTCRWPLLVESVCVDYRLYFDLDPGHRSFWTVYAHGRQKDRLFVAGRPGRRPARWCVRFPATPESRLTDRMALASNCAWTEPATWIMALALLVGILLVGRIAALPAAFCAAGAVTCLALLAAAPVPPRWPLTSTLFRFASALAVAAAGCLILWDRRRAAGSQVGRLGFAALAAALGAVSAFTATAVLPVQAAEGGRAAMLGVLAGNLAVVLSQALMAVLAGFVILKFLGGLRRRVPDSERRLE
jgi:hypothetical protein